MDGLSLYFFAIVGLATSGLGAFAVLALFVITAHRYLRLDMLSHSKEISDAEKAAGITHLAKEPK